MMGVSTISRGSGRPALALDLMEPFRPLIAESAVAERAINTRMVTPKDFVRAGRAVALTPAGRRGFFPGIRSAYGYACDSSHLRLSLSYRRLLEVQARLLAKVLEGELDEYAVFITR